MIDSHKNKHWCCKWRHLKMSRETMKSRMFMNLVTSDGFIQSWRYTVWHKRMTQLKLFVAFFFYLWPDKKYQKLNFEVDTFIFWIDKQKSFENWPIKTITHTENTKKIIENCWLNFSIKIENFICLKTSLIKILFSTRHLVQSHYYHLCIC